jgi:hypothetical protein
MQPEKGAEKHQCRYHQHNYALFINFPGLIQCPDILARFFLSARFHGSLRCCAAFNDSLFS